MKFGAQLRSSVIREYQWHYLDYDELKQMIKKGREWTEDDEAEFIKRLDEELEKVTIFKSVKSEELMRTIQTIDKDVHSIVARLDDQDRVNQDNYHEQPVPTEEEFMALEADLNVAVADVHDLDKFVSLNYTGFNKIVKKHDKRTSWHLKPHFASRLRAQNFFQNNNYELHIVKLSELLNIVRTRGRPAKGDTAAGGSQGNFIRQTTKYWVHPDNVTEVKLIILQHLPVLIYSGSKEFEQKDMAITSIYYDNPGEWDLYEGRLKKTQGAEAIRLRWYKGMDTEDIFVERKTHQEDWTGEKSVKARFKIKEKFVNPYLRGEILPSALFEKARQEGKRKESDIANDERLAKEVQYSVLKNGYVPVCRSFYNRTAFQLPADQRVRISLDTELTMVREDNLDGRKRSGDNWRRMDIGIDYPFPQLPPEDIERFPYAVLEVKLTTQNGQEPPQWIRDLISSHLVEAVPKFSKFIHGTATLFPTRINLLPFWMPQMDVDIRKPPVRDFGIKRPGQPIAMYSSDDEDVDSDDDTSSTGNGSGTGSTTARDTNSEGSKAKSISNHLGKASKNHQNRAQDKNIDVEGSAAANVGASNAEVEYLYDSEDSDDEEAEQDALQEARRIGGLTYFSKLMRHKFKMTEVKIVQAARSLNSASIATSLPVDWSLGAAAGQPMVKRFKAPKGKKIHVPVRIEPKVYFAAERTFLSWLEFSIYIGMIAVALLNFGSKPTRMHFFASGVFGLVAIWALLYSVFVYLYRVKAMRDRRSARYFDRLGPTVLCAAVFLAVVLNLVFELWDRGLGPFRGESEVMVG